MVRLFLVLLITPTPAFAYLDPGSGSMLLYFLMAVFASIVYYFKGFAYKFRNLFVNSKVDKRLIDLEDIEILFHSEGGQYWNVFKPIIDELEQKKVRSAYYTGKNNDPGLQSNYKYLKKEYIGNNIDSFELLKNIKVKLFITTTPQLNIFQFKKSKEVREYIHLIHSPTDALMYKYFAFDFFDSVMCSGKHQIESIREIELIRKTNKKELLETGLTYFDVLEKNKQKSKIENKVQKKILVAPTWKDNNLLEKYGTQPLKDLVDFGYKVILRPHPQMFISKKEVIFKIEKEIEKLDSITIDKSLNPESIMEQSDILISDLSGIIFDFYFVFEKPVIAINGIISKSGQEAELVSKEPWEIENLEKIASIIDLKDMKNIKKYIDEAQSKINKTNIHKFRDSSVFNYGVAGKVAANQLLQKIKN